MRKLKLEIESIPGSSWGFSLANKLKKSEWDKTRKKVYEEADWTCEICGSINETLNAHEVWAFDDRRKIQRLVRIECLCETCHDVKHFGRSKIVYPTSRVRKLIKHWCKINGRTEVDFNLYLKEVFEINKKRANNFYIIKVGNRILA